jgi:hypothetical protein
MRGYAGTAGVCTLTELYLQGLAYPEQRHIPLIHTSTHARVTIYETTYLRMQTPSINNCPLRLQLHLGWGNGQLLMGDDCMCGYAGTSHVCTLGCTCNS